MVWVSKWPRLPASPKSEKAKVPLKLEEGEMPLNTCKNKTPFMGKIKSVERIVGPKATGETTHIIDRRKDAFGKGVAALFRRGKINSRVRKFHL